MGISAALGSSALLPAGLGFRNMIINGNMVIDQRNAGAAVSSNGSYPADRWFTSSSTTGAWTFQQLSPTSGTASTPIPPTGFRSYIKFTKTTGATPGLTGEPNYFLQSIEGFNSAQLAWGRADAKPAVLSFWVYSGSTGTFGGSIRSTSVNYWSFPFSYTINTANTWEYKVIQISPITSGTWYTSNIIGVQLFFDLGSSADYKSAANSWANGNYISASGTSQYPTNTSSGYMCWTGIQLEQNMQPTPFEQRPYQTELALCQRYYEKTYDIDTIPTTNINNGMMYTTSSTNNAGFIFLTCRFAVPKRYAGYTVTFYRNTGTANVWTYARSGTSADTTMNYTYVGTNAFTAYTSNIGVGWVVAEVYGHWVCNAEL